MDHLTLTSRLTNSGPKIDEPFLGADPPGEHAENIRACLRASRSAAHMLGTPALFAVVRCDDGRILHANPAFESLVETSEDGQTFAELVSMVEPESVGAALDAVCQNGTSIPFRAFARTADDDSEVPPTFAGVCEPLGDAESVDSVLFHGVDLSSLTTQSLDIELRGDLESFIAAPGLIHAAFEAIDDAIFVVRLPERTIEVCNAAAAEMFEMTRSEMVGSSTEILHVDPQNYERFLEESRDAMNDLGSVRGRYRMKRSGGTTFPSEQVVGFVAADDEDAPHHSVNVIRDITEQIQQEENLRLINRVNTAIADADDYQSALRGALTQVGHHVEWECGEAWAPQKSGGDDSLELRSSWVAADDSVTSVPDRLECRVRRLPGDGRPMGGQLAKLAREKGETVWIDDLASSEHDGTSRATAAGLNKAMAVPVLRKTDVLAVLVWYTSQSTGDDAATRQLAPMIGRELGAFLFRWEIEEALREERDRFQMVASNVAEVFWMSNADKSTMYYVNPAYEEVWGRAREHALEHPEDWLEDVHEEDRERVREAAKRQHLGGYDEEYRIVRPDGELRWVRDRAYPIREDGETTRIVGVTQDITKQKRAEERLKKSEQKFSKAFRSNPLAMTIVDVQSGRFLDVNDGFCELTGWTRRRALNRRVDELELWEDAADRRNVHLQLANQGRVREFETDLRRADGDVRRVLISAQHIELDGRTCVLSATKDITERRRYQKKLERRTLHDVRTGLPNRRLFRNRLEHALVRAEGNDAKTGVVLVDVVRLRIVNDSLGHASGDRLLEIVANRLTEAVDRGVTVARYGGDEFALLFEAVDSGASLERGCEAWLDRVTAPCGIDGTTVHPQLSIGVGTSDAAVQDADDLLRYADIALSKAQPEAGNSIHRHEPTGDAPGDRRLHRELALRKAVEREEFTVRYQPIVALETGDIVGAEALVRWNHPDRGLVGPGEFIPLAEDTGLIVPMGYQVLETAMRDAAEWLERRPDSQTDPFRLSVNLSVRQYGEADLPQRIREIAAATEFPLDRLVLEITESILVTNESELSEMRAEGTQLVIDDFGTGYSSLQYLRRLEADGLKIDRSFLQKLDEGSREAVLLESMLKIGADCGLSVVVEGVETETQRELLLEMGAEYAQGFHFARPEPADTFASYLSECDESATISP